MAIDLHQILCLYRLYLLTCASSGLAFGAPWDLYAGLSSNSSCWQDICEDISDHVEQIHALLETEFSLKLLSYSVNIIVDIRSVQLLWHQLRVSVLVLKERLLQSLQDSNGNYTRQTDILQAFSQDHDEVS